MAPPPPAERRAIRVLAVCALAAVVGVPSAARAQSHNLGTYALFGDAGVVLGRGGAVIDGDVGTNGELTIQSDFTLNASGSAAADVIRVGPRSQVIAATFFNQLIFARSTSVTGATVSPLLVPLLPMPSPSAVAAGTDSIGVAANATLSVSAGAYDMLRVGPGATLELSGGGYDIDRLVVSGNSRSPSTVLCTGPTGCTVRVRTRLALRASNVGTGGSDLTFEVAGSRPAVIGSPGAHVRATVHAPLALLRLKSTRRAPSSFTGQFVGERVKVGSGATISRGLINSATCGNGALEPPGEECDPPQDAACPGGCLPDCQCTPPPGTPPTLVAIGPSVLNNATSFGVQIFGADFVPGAQLRLSDRSTNVVIETLPTTWISSRELSALVPAGMDVPSGIERELLARVINPDASVSTPPIVGHCQTDLPNSPIACTSTADCPLGAGNCVNGDQRLTMFDNLAFINPNSAAVVPAPDGLCDDGSLCQNAAACTGIGSGVCSPKLYVTPQERDELWVYNTGTAQFVDQDGGQAGIQGIPVGDNPFHVEMLAAGGPTRAWVVNRFDDALSIIDPATDTEIARVSGAALGVPGRLRMETEIEFNRAGTRAYLSNENLDEIQVLDISGAHRDAPLLVGSIDVGVNPRGMATNTADTRLYVANIQSADLSVIDIAPGSPTENQVVQTIAARAGDDIVGGRAHGWEPFVISGRAPRGIVFSDAQNALFVSSIGPQTGPRPGVGQTGGAILNPTVTVIDAASNGVLAHVALNGLDPDRPGCTDPELMALDDARNRLYLTCQGSGIVDVLDTGALMAGLPAELAMVPLPLPIDVSVPTLSIPVAITGDFGQKVCAPFAVNHGAACASDADCSGCQSLVNGVQVQCCATNNPIGLHNGPRGIAIAADRDTVYVVNQFTTSIAALDVSPVDPTLIAATSTTSYPGAFGSDAAHADRRLGQIDFFTDLKNTNTSCASCHIDDHQDGVFFEADVAGPRLRRVLSVRGTRDFPPLLQDQLLFDLAAFTDVVVHFERGGTACQPCSEPFGVFNCSFANCNLTTDTENQQNTTYAKAITFFPNPNLDADGSLSTAVPLPNGATGDARRGGKLFDQLNCTSCHPEPMFTIDQFRVFVPSGPFQFPSVRLRDVGTPVHIPLRANCQDANRPAGADGSNGFGVPTLRGIWDTFPLLLSGSAGLAVVGPEPAFNPGCVPGSNGCCTQLHSPLNGSGTAVPEQHLAVSTKDPIRALLTPPLAVPGSGHGAALALTPDDLDALIAYLRSL